MRAALFLLCLFFLPLNAVASDLAAERDALVASLRNYQRLKGIESRLKIFLNRASTAQRPAYDEKFEALKPQLYDAAQSMELNVASYSRNHGVASLCDAIPPDVKPLVPTCLKQTEPSEKK